MRKIEEEFNVGMNLVQSGNHQGAYEYFRSMLNRYPDNGYIWGTLGLVAFGLGRLDESRECYEKAATLDPASDVWKEQYAFSLIGVGEFDKVERLLGSSGTIGTLCVLAHMEEVRGNHKKSLELCEEVIEKASAATEFVVDGRKLPPAFFEMKAKATMARCFRHLKEPEKGIRVLESLPKSPELSYELGQLHDSAGNYDSAWECFEWANSHGLRYDPNRFQLKRTLERQYKGTHSSNQDGSRFIFIVGIPRSGTSLTEQILSMHPEVHAMGERRDFDWIANHMGHNWWPDLSPEQLDDLALSYTRGKVDGPVPPEGYVTDKMPGNWRHTRLIRQLLPGAKIVHCVRNPEDCLMSCFMQRFHTVGTAWSNSVEGLKHYYDEWLKTDVDADVTVRYEELVSDPDTEIPKLLKNLGLSFHEECLYPHKSKRHVATASYSQVKKPINNRSVGRGKNYAKFLLPIFTE